MGSVLESPKSNKRGSLGWGPSSLRVRAIELRPSLGIATEKDILENAPAKPAIERLLGQRDVTSAEEALNDVALEQRQPLETTRDVVVRHASIF